MAHFDLQGRWVSPPENLEVNLVMTGVGSFNLKAISAQLLKYWTGGYGEVFESGKLHATFTGPNPDVHLQGHASGDARTINWENGRIWRRR